MALIHRWTLDGDINNSVGNINGTASNVTYSSTERISGLSAVLNGATTNTSYISLDGLAIASYPNFTISMWARVVSSASSVQTYFQSASSSTLYYRLQLGRSSGKLLAGTLGASSWTTHAGSKAIDLNTWYFITLTSSGTPNATVKAYVNGVLDIDNTIPRYTEANDRFTLGALRFYNSNPYTINEMLGGNIDDARFYDTVLSPEEVRALYLSYTAPAWQRPLHRWKLDGNALDSAGNKDGTEVGTVEYSRASKVTGNYSAYFPGGGSDNTNYLSIPYINFLGYTNFSLSFWIRKWTPRPTTVESYIICTSLSSSDTQIFMVALSSNKIWYFIRDSSNTTLLNSVSTFDATVDVWNHVVIIDANGTVSSYFNGKPGDITGSYTRAAITFDNTRLANSGTLTERGSPSGFLDDVRFYDTALTAAEVKSLYNSYFTEKAASMMEMLG